METSTSTANLFANNSVSAFAVNGTNLVSTDLAVLAGRDATVQVGRSTAFVSREVAITAEDGVDLEGDRGVKAGRVGGAGVWWRGSTEEARADHARDGDAAVVGE